MKNARKTIRKRNSRKPTGRWAQHVIDLRRRAYGVDQAGKGICTQTELADALKVAPITISRWECGKQDPPPKERAKLSLAAEALGAGRDLELAFREGLPEQDQMIRDVDRAIVGLLRYLFLSQPLLDVSARKELDRIGKATFDLARAIAADSVTSRLAGAQGLLANEIIRLVKQIDQDEQGAFGRFSRSLGSQMYTDVKGGGK